MYINASIHPISDESFVTQYDIAASSTDPRVLAELMKLPYSEIRLLIAKNPNTSADTLIQLARDPHAVIRKAALANPSMPEEGRDRLQEYSDDFEFYFEIYYPDSCLDVEVTKKHDDLIRKNVARYINRETEFQYMDDYFVTPYDTLDEDGEPPYYREYTFTCSWEESSYLLTGQEHPLLVELEDLIEGLGLYEVAAYNVKRLLR